MAANANKKARTAALRFRNERYCLDLIIDKPSLNKCAMSIHFRGRPDFNRDRDAGERRRVAQNLECGGLTPLFPWFAAGFWKKKCYKQSAVKPTHSNLFWIGDGEIPVLGPHEQLRQTSGRMYRHLDLVPLAVGHKIFRLVTNRVLMPQLQSDLLKDVVHLSAAARIEGFAA